MELRKKLVNIHNKIERRNALLEEEILQDISVKKEYWKQMVYEYQEDKHEVL